MGFKSKAGKNHYDIRNQRLQLPIISQRHLYTKHARQV